LSASDVWTRLVNCGVADQAAVHELRRSREKSSGAGEENHPEEKVLQWLVDKGKLTGYQQRVLLAGHDGPFRYGDYMVTARAESGALPAAFHAVHLPTDHPALLVFVGGDDVAAANRWKDWKQLASLWNGFGNGFVQEIHEAVTVGNWRFVVLPWFRGKSLLEKVPAGGRVPWIQSAQSLEHLTMGLQAIHLKGLVHGRISPKSIWVQKGAVCQLMPPLDLPGGSGDEDIARDYSSPALRGGTRSIAARDDMFALGQVAVRLLSGSSIPMNGNDAESRTAELQPLNLKLAAREMPLAMQELVRGLLTADVSATPINADAAIALLRTALEGQSTAADLDIGPKTRVAYRSHLVQPPRDIVGGKARDNAAGEEAPVSAVVDIGRNEPLGDVRSRLPARVDLGQLAATMPNTAVSQTGIRTRSRKPASRLPVFISAGIVIASVAIGLLLTQFTGDDDEMAKTADDSVADTRDSADTDGAKGEAADVNKSPAAESRKPAESEWFRQTVVNGNQELAWESPTAGSPLDLSRVPPAPDLVIVLRPANLFGEAGEGEGVKLARAIGPGFEALKTNWESLTGVPLHEVSAMTISLHPESGKHNIFVQAELSSPKNRQALAQNDPQWKPAASPVEDTTVFTHGDWQAGFIADPADERNVTVVFIANGSLLDALQPAGFEARCDPAMRELVSRADSSRHATILMMNSALTSEEGDKLFQGVYAVLRRPLAFFFNEHVKAFSLSLHFDRGSYLELMTAQTLDLKTKDAAEHLRQKLAGLAALLSPVTEGGTSSYWGPLQQRFAKMVDELVRNTRVAAEREGVIANCWLPAPALHNLVAGAELAMAVGPGDVETVVATELPANVDQLLQTRRTLRITNSPDLRLLLEDFQNEVRDDFQDLSFEFNIRLMGEDLQADGITQNQRPGNLDLADKTIAEILAEIMYRANPDKNATGTQDEKCKLVWVIADDPEKPGNQAVLVTTRKAAAAKGYTLPAAFRSEAAADGN
jgi:eukaryotic-like serine/threonine-protein kinase